MKSKNLIILLSSVLIFALAACKPSSPTPTPMPIGNAPQTTNPTQNTTENPTTPPAENKQGVSPAELPEHGCVVEQGYKWCEEMQKCYKEGQEKCEKPVIKNEGKSSYYLIADALAKESGKSVNEFTLGIKKLTETYFRGIVSGKEGTVLAVKQDDNWVIVFDSVFGNKKTYACSDVEKYNFPDDMISDCTK